jgi:hypothetical protein
LFKWAGKTLVVRDSWSSGAYYRNVAISAVSSESWPIKHHKMNGLYSLEGAAEFFNISRSRPWTLFQVANNVLKGKAYQKSRNST